ncbi:MAG: carboxymuconolactone decarboxylase family protein [Psychroflexus sp.]|nr:carboxymuconolactone decarboxylase family protein [Psychroflexus sp.]MDN6310076.1 carboxymuconolactone decarboxylase family protein [Psychroflexus sp.]
MLHTEGAPGLTEKEIAAVALAAAMASHSDKLFEAIEELAKKNLSEAELKGAKTAHAIMSMTNVYYRFLHVADNQEYKRMPSKLRRTAENKSGLDQSTFELAALGVSAINNCKACIDFHELSLRRMEVSAEGIQSAVRIAAVMNAVGELLKF